MADDPDTFDPVTGGWPSAGPTLQDLQGRADRGHSTQGGASYLMRIRHEEAPPTRCSKAGTKLDWERAPRAPLRALAERPGCGVPERRGPAGTTGSVSSCSSTSSDLKKPARVPVTTLCGLLRRQAQRPLQEGVHARLREGGRGDREVPRRLPARLSDRRGGSRPGLRVARARTWSSGPGALLPTRPPGSTWSPSIWGRTSTTTSSPIPRLLPALRCCRALGRPSGRWPGLSPFTDMMEATTMLFSILPFADPAVVEGVQRLAARRPGVPQLAHDHRCRRRRRGRPAGHPPCDGRLRPRRRTTSWPTRCAAPRASCSTASVSPEKILEAS